MESAKFVSGIHKCKRIPQTVSGFRFLFITKLAYKQLKARAGTLIYGDAEFKGKDITIVSGIHEQISKYLLTMSVETPFDILKTQHRIILIFGVIRLTVYGNTTHSKSPTHASIWDCVNWGYTYTLM